MRVLIVGCGYLGQRVAERWQAAGCEVSVTTRSPVRAAEFQQRGWRPIVADLCEPSTLESLPTVDLMLVAVGYDRQSGRTQREVYVDGLHHLLRAMQGRCPSVISISSSSVYGQQAGEWVDEDSVCEPVQPGGQCCLDAEALVRDFWTTSTRTATVLRLSGIYGPGRLLSRTVQLTRQEPLAGSPAAWLNLIHVDDAAAAVLAAGQSSASGLYLVSDDEPVRRGDYYQQLAELIGAPPPLFDESQPARHGAGGINKRCCNTRLKHNLGITLQYPNYRLGLPQALANTANPNH